MTSQATPSIQTQPVDIAASVIALTREETQKETQSQSSTLPTPLLEQVRSRAMATSGASRALKERWKYTRYPEIEPPYEQLFDLKMTHTRHGI